MWYLLVILLAGCARVEGPCHVLKDRIICDQGGQATVFGPAGTIESAGSAAAEAQPQFTDPMLIVPPRQRR